jgi:hypothetical protein
MSDTVLHIVPAEPVYRPSPSAAIAAEHLLRSFWPGCESITAVSSERIRFVDAGENWEGVACPQCGADAEAWWSDAVSEAHESQYQSLIVRAACCGATVSLNELRYGWPVAFASFSLEALNPGTQDLSPEQRAQLESVLGCPVRLVEARV